MTTIPLVSNIPNVKKLEYQLERQKDNKQRIILLDKLASHYAFTNVKKARKLLDEQRVILESFEHPDIKLNFHVNTAFVENQLYNHNLSEMHYKTCIDILEDMGDIKQQADALIDYAGTCMNLDKKELANTVLEKASKLLEVFPDENLEARITCRLGYLNLHYSNYTKAIELLLESEKKIYALHDKRELKDYYFFTLIHSGLGRIYERNEDKEKCVKEYLKVVDLCESLKMRTRLSWHYLNVGNAYMNMNDADSAEIFFQKAIRIKDDISQNARAGAYANLGFCYFKKGGFTSALRLYKRAEELYRAISKEDFTNFSIIENWKAKLYLAEGRQGKAKKHLINAFIYAKRKSDFKQLSIVCKDIAAYYADIEDYQNAYEYQLLHNKMVKKHNEEVNSRMLYELEVKYEAEKKKQETELLRLEATGLQLKALRAQMNPHFLYNALNAIQSYITSHEVTYAAKYLAKFAKLMRQSLDYSDKESISLEEEIEFLEDYLIINQKLRFEDNLHYEIKVGEEIEEDIMGVPTMIVQPYVENAIEHGLRSIKDGILKLEFSLVDDTTILCVVVDNGVGRKRTKELQLQDQHHQNHHSKGTSVTEKRLNILNKSRRKGVFVKTIDMEDEKTGEAKGTRVEILIPIVEIQLK